ncbi:MAG: RnfABCDGE type electron transport complex subunit G [Kiritimatiellia bacterium]|jgi:electron transport complex protein RnfG|nr:RnfABCDGE type electron transport complex subunit G [Kiritimatiellia bacterium]MDP6631084.1 RnfABCDGE type electron transport complex subunit G [Kiritimatiellia bacterium]MDP6810040.1 RnfABCDGE type electron transport complex subunit G [Kiritimatiellia bacterium]MDP7024811.1 RnfABCDGE type electron transport complex subunit G [Kiritimatiellia bacterium]
MMESLKLVVVLTLICTVGGALLAVVHDVTAAPIAAAAVKEKNDAIMQVLPECDNNPGEDVVTVDADGQTWTFYVARKAGAFVGAAFEAVSNQGYGGDIVIMVGVNAEGSVQAIEVLAHKETPGLGAWISGESFRGQFAGRSIAETKWAVAKDGGDIDQITAATISSRAVTQAVKAGLDVCTANMTALAGNQP